MKGNAISTAGDRKFQIGTVISNKMDKTVVVAVETAKRHPIYGRSVRRTKRYKAHDQNNTCLPGDQVRIVETRPISREKRWIVASIVRKGEQIDEIREVEGVSTGEREEHTSKDEEEEQR